MKLLSMMYLGINAWTDGRRKEIDLRYTVVFVLIIAVIRMWTGTPQNWKGLLPGSFLWVMSQWKKEKIGNGDGFVAAGLGWAIGLEEVWKVLTGGFLLAGCTGILLLALGRKKTTELPFIPFLCMSFLLGRGIR